MKKSFFKRALSLVLCLILTSALSAVCLAASENAPLAVAHRGHSAAAPENTLSAFRLAGELGYYGCEFDIRPTKDKVWVVMHNETVDNMTNGSGKVSELTYDEISALKIDSGNGLSSYPDEKVPTLEEALDVCREYSIRPVIEIKGGDENDVVALAEYLNSRDDRDSFIIISFTWEILAPLRKLMPNTEMWLLANEVRSAHIEFCKENKIDAISFNHKKNTLFTGTRIVRNGLKAVSWTVDRASTARLLLAGDVTGITTNKLLPEELQKKNAAWGVEEFFEELVDALSRFFSTLFPSC